MSRLLSASVATLAVLCAACAAGTGSGRQPSGPGRQPAGAGGMRAQPSDTVFVIEHYVRPERKQQFEDFVREVLWPAFRKDADSRGEAKQVLDRLRLLQPMAPDEDGVLRYAFVLDPHVPGEAYDVYHLLLGLYPEGEALRQYTRFTETWARDFTARPYIQFADPAR